MQWVNSETTPAGRIFALDLYFSILHAQSSKKHHLSQIKICFNRHLKMIDCADLKHFYEVQGHGNCPEEAVFYPSSVK